MFQSFSTVNGKQTFKVVAIGAVASERILIKQAFDAAAGTHLVSTALRTDGPAHSAVPTTPKNDGRSGESGRHQSHGPKPLQPLGFRDARCLLWFFFHSHSPGVACYKSGYADSAQRAMCMFRGKGRPWSKLAPVLKRAGASRSRLGGRWFPSLDPFGSTQSGGVTFVYRGTLQAGTKPGNLPVTPGCKPVKAEGWRKPVIGRTVN